MRPSRSRGVLEAAFTASGREARGRAGKTRCPAVRGSVGSEARHRPAEAGFTLVELMVVVLIIAILMAIAIPTFLGARRRAMNRAAQASLRIAVTAEMAYYASNGETFTSDPDLLKAEEYGLYWMGPNASTHFKEVSVDHSFGDYLCLAVASPSGDSFGMVVEIVPPANTLYGNSVPTRASDFCAGHTPGMIPAQGNWSTDPSVGWAT